MLTVHLTWLSIGIVGALYFGVCLYLYARQQRMIFAATQSIGAAPESKGLDYEAVWVSISPNTDDALYGWWIPAETPRGAVLFLHGKACTISDNLERAARFHRLGFTVLLADYRGYGLSKGLYPNERRVYEDAEAMWRYLTEERGVAPTAVMIYGHSLGGAIAIELAARHPNAACLMVESSFTCMQAMATQNVFLKPFPVGWLLSQEFNSLKKVQSLPMPKLFAHGKQDNVVPYGMGQKLYQAASEPKRLLINAEADHENVAKVAEEAYSEAVLWLSQFMTH